GEAFQCFSQYGPETCLPAIGGRTAGMDFFQQILLTVPVVEGFGDAFNEVGFHTQGLAGIADGAAVAIGDGDGGQSCPFTAVAVIDVLYDFFPALVFEIHIDVGRLIAFAADETCKQIVAVLGVDFGDAQAITNGGIGRRAAALAENAALAGEFYDVIDCEKVGLIGQVLNDGELVIQLGHDGRGNAPGVAAQPAGQGFLAQVLGRCH